MSVIGVCVFNYRLSIDNGHHHLSNSPSIQLSNRFSASSSSSYALLLSIPYVSSVLFDTN
jgi:hypothetical protein